MSYGWGVRRIAVFLAAISVLAPSLFGQSTPPWCPGNVYTPPPPPSLYPEPPPCKLCDSCKKSPCYVKSGAYAADAMDLQLPTPGFPLTASRHYVSSRAIDGPLGIGWISSLSPRLYYATYLFAAPSTYRTEAVITMPDGWQYVFIENADGITYAPPLGRHDTLIKNGYGSWTMTLQRSHDRYFFAANGALTTMVDEFGNTLAWSYDGSGRVNRISDMSGSGRFLATTWGPDGRVATVEDSGNRQIQYAYDSRGVLTSVTNAAGQATSYSYVAGRFAPLMSEIRDHWGRVITDIAYDSADRVQSYSELGETFTYTYNPFGYANQTSKTDSLGDTWTFGYTATGQVNYAQGPAAAGYPVNTWGYGPDGSITTETDPTGVQTQYTYDAGGSVLTTTRDAGGPLSLLTRYAYDENFPEKVVSVTPWDTQYNRRLTGWAAWRYDYYQAGSTAPGALFHVYRIETDGTVDTVSTYEYNFKGQVTRITDATSGVTDYAYDAQGNLYTVTGPANNDAGTRPVTTYGYDSLGRVISVTDALGHVTSYTYDAVDRVLTVTLPKPSVGSPLDFTTAYSYDNYDPGTGLLFTNVTDPNGRVTKQGYDQFGRLGQSIDALNALTAYAYSHGHLASITDANGNLTSYAYDVLGRLSSTNFPDGAQETYTYWADSLLKTKTDRKSQTITYNYDHLKRLTSKVYPNATSIAYTYTGQKLTQVVDTSVSPTETHTFSYDASYRVSSNTQATRGTLNYQYDAADRVSHMDIQGGPSTDYAYYPDGSLDTIVWSPIAGQFKYSYTLNGQYGTIAFPNGQHRDYTYDDQGRLTQIANVHPTAGNLATYGYGYDVDNGTGQSTMLGQRTSMTATVPAQGFSNSLTNYYYDSDYQLTRADYPNVAPLSGEIDQWSYDLIGNRLTNTVNGSAQNYTYQKIGTNPNNWQRLLSDGVNSYTYDSNGSTITRNGSSGSYTFSWDYENRMYAIGGAETDSYVYDYQGRRSSKTVAGATTTYLYDNLNLIGEAGASPANYVFGPGIDEPLAMSRSGSVYYYGVDALGSVADVGDSAGSIQDSYIFDAWGVAKSQTGSLANPFAYTAREWGEAGMLFYRARYLQPSVGRFVSEDPLRFRAGPRWFSYVLNRPSRLRDSLGLTGQPGIPDTIYDEFLKCVADIGAQRRRAEAGCASSFATCMQGCAPPYCPLVGSSPPRSPLPFEYVLEALCEARCRTKYLRCMAGADAAYSAKFFFCFYKFKKDSEEQAPGIPGDPDVPGIR
jgi:RHS repeat-associated protein